MKTYLKIKILSLAEEIRIIRREEHRWQDRPLWVGLNLHRKGLNAGVRHAHLAYGFLKGRDYKALEKICYYEPRWDLVERMVRQFGGGYAKGRAIDVERDVMQRWHGWLEQAKVYANKEVCKARRVDQKERGTKRRLDYKAKYWRPDHADQLALKRELKAKWDAKWEERNKYKSTFYHTIDEAMKAAYPWGYRSDQSEP